MAKPGITGAVFDKYRTIHRFGHLAKFCDVERMHDGSMPEPMFTFDCKINGCIGIGHPHQGHDRHKLFGPHERMFPPHLAKQKPRGWRDLQPDFPGNKICIFPDVSLFGSTFFPRTSRIADDEPGYFLNLFRIADNCHAVFLCQKIKKIKKKQDKLHYFICSQQDSTKTRSLCQ